MINWRKNSSTSIQKERYPIQISKLTTNIAPSTSGNVARCGCKYGVIKGQNIAKYSRWGCHRQGNHQNYRTQPLYQVAQRR